MLVVDSERWYEMPLFRDYLIAHPVAAREYKALKRRLAAEFRFDRDQYTDAKTEFVRSTLIRAMAWQRGSRTGSRRMPR